MRYEIELSGPLPSKKNRYMPRRDRPGFFKNQRLRDELDRLIIQVPGQLRDLKLEHPNITMQMFVRNSQKDRDNGLTAILDILVCAGVLKNDSIARCNGKITLLPAIFTDYDKTIITLETAQ